MTVARPWRVSRWVAVAGVTMALALSGCGGTEEVGFAEPEALAFVDDPHQGLTPEDSTWAEFEARRLCDAQRTTFDAVDGPELALEVLLEANGAVRAEYDGFIDRLAADQGLRVAVRYSYEQFCRG